MLAVQMNGSQRHLCPSASLLWLPVVLSLLLTACQPTASAPVKKPESQTPASPVATGFPVTLTDALGRKVTLEKRPERIISLIPSMTEYLFALGVGDRVVANTPYCDFPEAARSLPKVGAYLDPDMEKILSLKPDLVFVGRGNKIEVVNALEQNGIKVLKVESKSFDEVLHDIEILGQAVGEVEKARTLGAELARTREQVVQTLSPIPFEKRPRVLFLFSLQELYTVGPGSHINELIALGGGNNLGKDAPASWSQLSPEKIVAFDPEVIIVGSASDSGKNPVTLQQAQDYFNGDKRWKNLSAVKNGRIAVIDRNLISRPGPRIGHALMAFARVLHPTLFVDKTVP